MKFDLSDPLCAVYGYYSEEEEKRYGCLEYLTYKGNVVRVTTVLRSHADARPGQKFVACLAEFLGKVRQVG